MEKRVELHEFQSQAFLSLKDIIVALAGKRGGKSVVGALWLITLIRNDIAKGIKKNYLIVSPTHGLMNKATLVTFKKYFPRSLGVHKRADQVIELVNGGLIYLCSADTPDRIEGFEASGGCWADEAGQYSLEVFYKIQQRLTSEDGTGRLFISTTPYGSDINWLNKEILLKLADLPYVEVVRWSTKDNPHISSLVYERAKATMRKELFLRDFEGLYQKLEGLIYTEFDRKSMYEQVDPVELPEDAPTYAGIDFGAGTSATIIVKEDINTHIFYVVDLLYGPNISSKEKAEFLSKYKIKQVLGDPAAGDAIVEMKKVHKVPIATADNSVDVGIERITTLIKRGKLKIFNTVKDSLCTEFENYHYKPGTDKPVKELDHALDALRYLFSKNILLVYPELKYKKPEVFKEKTVEDPLQLRTQVTSPESPDAWDYKPITDPDSI